MIWDALITPQTVIVIVTHTYLRIDLNILCYYLKKKKNVLQQAQC